MFDILVKGSLLRFFESEKKKPNTPNLKTEKLKIQKIKKKNIRMNIGKYSTKNMWTL